MALIQINANLVWEASQGVESNHWIGNCPALGIATEAETLDELHSLIPEAIHLLMIDLLEDDELDQFLEDRGWTADRQETMGTGEPEFRVPWNLVASGVYGSSRTAH